MLNRDQALEALHNYISTFDDEAIFEFTCENQIEGILTCDQCQQLFGDCFENSELCKKRFLAWLEQKSIHDEQN